MRKIKNLIVLSVAIITICLSSLTVFAYPGGEPGSVENEYLETKLKASGIKSIYGDSIDDPNWGFTTMSASYCRHDFDEYGNVIKTYLYGTDLEARKILCPLGKYNSNIRYLIGYNNYIYSDPVHHKLGSVSCSFKIYNEATNTFSWVDMPYEIEDVGEPSSSWTTTVLSNYVFDGDVMYKYTLWYSPDKGLYTPKGYELPIIYVLDPEYGCQRLLYRNNNKGRISAYTYDELNRVKQMTTQIDMGVDFSNSGLLSIYTTQGTEVSDYFYYKNTSIVSAGVVNTYDTNGNFVKRNEYKPNYMAEVSIVNGDLTGGEGTGLISNSIVY